MRIVKAGVPTHIDFAMFDVDGVTPKPGLTDLDFSKLIAQDGASASPALGPVLGSNEFGPTAAGPRGICVGPDGNLWYTDATGDKIGQITPAGVTTEFPLTGGSHPFEIVTGPDGLLWFTENGTNKVAKMTTGGSVTEYALTGAAAPVGICVGPDGNLWVAENGTSKIAKVTTGGAVTEYATTTPTAGPFGICAGPDGNLWFAENLVAKVAKITTGGVVTEYSDAASAPTYIVRGPDGNLWYTRTATQLGKITTGGVVSGPYTVGTSIHSLVAGPDGNIWIADAGGNTIQAINTAGGAVSGLGFFVFTGSSGVWGLALGPNGAWWYTENSVNKIGTVSLYNAVFVREVGGGLYTGIFSPATPLSDWTAWVRQTTYAPRGTIESMRSTGAGADALDVNVSTRVATADARLNHLNADVSSRASWDDATSGHTTPGSFGAVIGTNLDAQVSTREPSTDPRLAHLNADITTRASWDDATSGHTVAGSFGALIGTNVDAPISSREPSSDPRLNHLDADISSRASAASVTNLDVPVSSRASWDDATSGHTVAGSFGLEIGTNLDQPVSTRLASSDVRLNNLANADVATSTRLAATDARLAHLNADISSRAQPGDPMTLADGAVDYNKVTPAAADKMADHTLRRKFQNVRTSSDGDALSFRSLAGAVAKQVNDFDIAGTTLNIRDDQGAVLGTQALTATPGANPITAAHTN